MSFLPSSLHPIDLGSIVCDRCEARVQVNLVHGNPAQITTPFATLKICQAQSQGL